MKIVNGFFILIATGLMMLSLSGCGLAANSSNNDIPDQSATDTQQQTDQATVDEPSEPTESEAMENKSEIVDNTPPEVTGEHFEITQGESVSYKKHIVVSDDQDENPVIEIDNSAVDLDTVGEYPVIYHVTDSAGNTTSLTLRVTVKEYIPDEAATEEYVLYLARQILDDITDESMSDLQVAYAIYRWSKFHIGYIGTSDKSSWVIGAYDAFTKYQGDCFNYFSASKALLTAAGIENFDLERPLLPDGSRHYWSLVNVGDGWYHFDSTPYRLSESNFFMLTDSEIRAWDDKYYKGDHAYSTENVPEIATQSIQSKVNYNAEKLQE